MCCSIDLQAKARPSHPQFFNNLYPCRFNLCRRDVVQPIGRVYESQRLATTLDAPSRYICSACARGTAALSEIEEVRIGRVALEHDKCAKLFRADTHCLRHQGSFFAFTESVTVRKGDISEVIIHNVFYDKARLHHREKRAEGGAKDLLQVPKGHVLWNTCVESFAAQDAKRHRDHGRSTLRRSEALGTFSQDAAAPPSPTWYQEASWRCEQCGSYAFCEFSFI